MQVKFDAKLLDTIQSYDDGLKMKEKTSLQKIESLVQNNLEKRLKAVRTYGGAKIAN